MTLNTLTVDFPDLSSSVNISYESSQISEDDVVYYFRATYGTFVLSITFNKFLNLISKLHINDVSQDDINADIDSKVLNAIINTTFAIAEEDWNEKDIKLAC